MPVTSAFGLTAAASLDGGLPFRAEGALYAACGALAIYSADRLGDARFSRAAHRMLIVGMGIGFAGSLYLLRTASLHSWAVASGAGILGLLHRWSRRWFPKNVAVAAAWCAVTLDAAGVDQPSIYQIAALTVTIWSACVLCDLKDDVIDRSDGTITIATLVGHRGRRWSAVTGLLLAIGLTRAGHLPWLGITAVILMPLALAPTLTADAQWGSILVDGTLALPGMNAVACHLLI